MGSNLDKLVELYTEDDEEEKELCSELDQLQRHFSTSKVPAQQFPELKLAEKRGTSDLSGMKKKVKSKGQRKKRAGGRKSGSKNKMLYAKSGSMGDDEQPSSAYVCRNAMILEISDSEDDSDKSPFGSV